MSAASGSTTQGRISFKDELIVLARRTLSEWESGLKPLNEMLAKVEDVRAENPPPISDAQADNLLEFLRRVRGTRLPAPLFDILEANYVKKRDELREKEEKLAILKKSAEHLEDHHAKLAAALKRFDDLSKSPTSKIEELKRTLKEIANVITTFQETREKNMLSILASL